MRRTTRRTVLAAGAIAALLLEPPLAAQIAPGPNVNPRTVWSNPPESFTSRIVATGFEDPYEVA